MPRRSHRLLVLAIVVGTLPYGAVAVPADATRHGSHRVEVCKYPASEAALALPGQRAFDPLRVGRSSRLPVPPRPEPMRRLTRAALDPATVGVAAGRPRARSHATQLPARAPDDPLQPSAA